MNTNSLCVAIVAALPFLATAQAGGSSGANCGVVSVLCNSQGQTDMRQRITVTVDHDGDPSTPPITATADLPPHSTSKDFADLLAWILREKGCPADSVEPDYIQPWNPLTDHLLDLPAGAGITSSKVEKKLSGGWDTGNPDHLRFTPGCSNGAQKRIAQPNQLTYNTFDFSLDQFAVPVVLGMTIKGINLSDMSDVDVSTTVQYPSQNVLPYNRLQAIGQFLQGLGMTVTYPNQKKLHAEVGPSNIQVLQAFFIVDTKHGLGEYTLAYSFRPN